ncbi:general stress protein [Peribacillus kribbensis]|uniref:general stress protein n=1 Tax=Peribacillus kribbensis TaxID=356658 RepID=UPI000403E0B8
MMNKRVVGVYDDGNSAIAAVEDLQEQGYARDEISVIAKDPEEAREITDETGTKAGEGAAAGATTGGVLGGLTGFLAGVGALAIPGIGPILAAGPIAATIAGAATGAGAGGIAGALIGMGIPDEEAERYESDLKSGKILVLVDADSRRGMTAGTMERDRSGVLNPGSADLGSRDLDRAGTTDGTVLGSGDPDRVHTMETDRTTLDSGMEGLSSEGTGLGERRNNSVLSGNTAQTEGRIQKGRTTISSDDDGFMDRTNRLDDETEKDTANLLEETKDPLLAEKPMVDATQNHEGTVNPFDRNSIVTDTNATHEGRPVRRDHNPDDPIA